MDKITADASTLMNQGPMTAATYMDAAVKYIDDKFGEGYARANPALLGAFINASAMDYGASVITAALQDVGEGLHHIGYAVEGREG